MKFDKIHEHLWAVRWNEKSNDELAQLFDQWSDVSSLRIFFKQHATILDSYFHSSVNQAIIDTLEDAKEFERILLDLNSKSNLDALFVPLGDSDANVYCLQRNKARIWNRKRHDCWLRIYALKLERGIYVITGGAIKLTQTMQADKRTQKELDKIGKCRDFLTTQDVFDWDSFNDFILKNK